VFRILQTDPLTSAVHVNIGAIRAHRYGDTLLECIRAVRDGRSFELIQLLIRMPDSTERAHAIALTTGLLHELKHQADMLVTPFAFNRLRSALAFYQGLHRVAGDPSVKLIFPLAQVREENLDFYDAKGMDQTFAGYLSRLVQSHFAVLQQESEPMVLPGGLPLMVGGDGILEALGFSVQAELAAAPGFNTRETRRVLPFAYNLDDEEAAAAGPMAAIDGTYRWYFPLINAYADAPGGSEARLMQALLLASLFGSFMAGRKPRAVDPDAPTPPEITVRDVSDLMPSVRLGQLIEAVQARFPSRRLPELGWAEAWAVANAAHVACFGKDVATALREDLESDDVHADLLGQELQAARAAGASEEIVKVDPASAHLDLLKLRRALCDVFLADPVEYLRPFAFPEFVDQHLRGYLYFATPKGDEGPFDDALTVCDGSPFVEFQVRGETETRRIGGDTVVYGSIRRKTARNPDLAPLDDDPPIGLMGLFAPWYKLALNGLHYQPLCEAETHLALPKLSRLPCVTRIDTSFCDVWDVSSAAEYFRFYDLETARCDYCSRVSDQASGRMASAATLRGVQAFVDEMTRRGPLQLHQFTQRDWSEWFLCSECQTTLLGLDEHAPSEGGAHDLPRWRDQLAASHGLSSFIEALRLAPGELDIQQPGHAAHFLRYAIPRGMDLIEAEEWEAAHDLWTKFGRTGFLSAQAPVWADRPYLRLVVRHAQCQLAIASIQVAREASQPVRYQQALDHIGEIIECPPASLLADHPSLSEEQVETFDYNLSNSLDFFRRWFEAYGVDMISVLALRDEADVAALRSRLTAFPL